MYMVYWTLKDDGVRTAHAKGFDSGDMVAAMDFMETLRFRQRAGEGVCFITMSSENPDSVGPAGVAETGSDYQWKKRRR